MFLDMFTIDDLATSVDLVDATCIGKLAKF